ncbi:hypothetical protein F4778DRAFT_796494 [Xylariomycetidae sp. FL2044]|nr:hypothetical protein F4778DRAFT_796494 [Xylariomycetidae sp. FL2044]
MAPYGGNLTNSGNLSAPINDSENVSVFISGLPKAITIPKILRQIRGVGKIYQVTIQPPDVYHANAAIKVVLFDPPSATRLFQLVDHGGLDFPGYSAQIRKNMFKRPAQTDTMLSRVIRVQGDASIVNIHSLQTFFDSKTFLDHGHRRTFYYDLDKVVDHGVNQRNLATIEIHFGSVRCQSQWAKRFLETDARTKGLVAVEYDYDPCS